MLILVYDLWEWVIILISVDCLIYVSLWQTECIFKSLPINRLGKVGSKTFNKLCKFFEEICKFQTNVLNGYVVRIKLFKYRMIIYKTNTYISEILFLCNKNADNYQQLCDVSNTWTIRNIIPGEVHIPYVY